MKNALSVLWICGLLLWAGCAQDSQALTPHEQGQQSTDPDALALSRIDPPSYPTLGGVELQLYGQGFAEGVKVAIDDELVNTVVYVSANLLRVTLPPRFGRPGPAVVKVFKSNGSGVQRADLFRYGYTHTEFKDAKMIIATKQNTESLVTADFNRDGEPDLAFTDRTGVIHVQLHDKNGLSEIILGTEAPSWEFFRIWTGDFNGDGNPDLIQTRPDGFNVLFGDGKGSFPSDTGAWRDEWFTWQIAIGDFNGDGCTDFAAADTSGPFNDHLYVWSGSRNGILVQKNTEISNLRINRFATGDANKDGNSDLLILDYDRKIHIIRGDRSGNFNTEAVYKVDDYLDGYPEFIAMDDFNGDKWPDIAVSIYNYSNNTKGKLLVLLGNELGVFSQKQIIIIDGTINDMTINDFNKDNFQDLAVVTSTGLVNVLFGSAIEPFQRIEAYPVGVDSHSLVPMDFNHDGNADLAMITPGNQSISVLLADTPGKFAAGTMVQTQDYIEDVAVGDYDSSGTLDLAVLSSSPAGISVSIHLGQGKGIFAAPRSYNLTDRAQPASPRLVQADINGDGHLDLIATGGIFAGGIPSLEVLLGTGQGTFTRARVQVPEVADLIAVGNIDGNRHPDLVITHTTHTLDPKVCVMLGIGNAIFSPETCHSIGGTPVSLAIADLNNDGLSDIAVANRCGRGVNLLYGTIEGSFTVSGSLLYSPPSDIQVGDVDQDGWPDLIVARQEGSIDDNSHVADCNGSQFSARYVQVLLGSKHGFVEAQKQKLSGDGTLVLQDLDLDGRLDLVMLSAQGSKVFLGKNFGQFLWTQSLVSRGSQVDPMTVTGMLADMDQDGQLDLVVAERGLHTVVIHKGISW